MTTPSSDDSPDITASKTWSNGFFWSTGPAPACLRYDVVGEEDDEQVVIAGHQHDDHDLHVLVAHAGFGSLFEPFTVRGEVVYDGVRITDIPRVETWARLTPGCPRHGWVPWWAHAVVRAADRARSRLYQVVWQRLWARVLATQPHRGQRPLPASILWLGRTWRLFENCLSCEAVEHHRTCRGCGWCAGPPHKDHFRPASTPLMWDWERPPGAPLDVHAGRDGYQPVTILSLMRGVMAGE